MSRSRLRNAGLLFLAWTVLGLFMASQSLTERYFSRDPTPWWHYLTSWLVGFYIWFALTPLVLCLGRRFPLTRAHWLRASVRHWLFAIFISIFQLALEAAILHRLHLFPLYMTSYSATAMFLAVIGFHGALLTYWIVLAMQHAAKWYRQNEERRREALRLQLRSSELQAQLTGAHLNALKMQLQPHFLFNTLNTVMVLVRQQKGAEAEEMIGLLSDLLRFVLEDIETQEVPLERELECVQLYLAIEQVRFRDRLTVNVTVPAELLDAAVPQMILQPIVENAIRHGISRQAKPGTVGIEVEHTGNRLRIIVQNDGLRHLVPDEKASHGIGVANTRARLHQLYGEDGQFELRFMEHGGAVATLTLPYRAAAWIPANESNALHSISC